MAKKKKEEEYDDSGFEMPDFDDVREYGSVVSEGWHAVSLVKMIGKKSNSNKPMVVADQVIDCGDFMGSKLTGYFVVGGGVKIGWSILKKIAVATGFRWEKVKNEKQLAEQFMDLEEPLRYEVRIRHQRNIKINGTWKNGVSEEQYESYIEQGGEDHNIRPEIADYRALTEENMEPDLTLGFASDDEEEKMLSPDDIETEAPTVADDDDDDLPF